MIMILIIILVVVVVVIVIVITPCSDMFTICLMLLMFMGNSQFTTIMIKAIEIHGILSIKKKNIINILLKYNLDQFSNIQVRLVLFSIRDMPHGYPWTSLFVSGSPSLVQSNERKKSALASTRRHISVSSS